METWLWSLFRCGSTFEDCFKALDGLLEGYQFAGGTDENLSDLEGLREETLNLTCPGYNQFVILRKFIHTKDGDDILKGSVILKEK